MAFNLWEAGGKPPSYNPLPPGTGNSVIVPFVATTLVCRFKARSDSPSARVFLQWGTDGFSVFLTSKLTSYEREVNKNGSLNSLYLIDVNNVGNIVIEDIEVVEKPMAVVGVNNPAVKVPKKNLINPLEKVFRFNDGGITFTADYAFQVNSLTTELALYLVEVKPNTQYTVKGVCNQAGGTRVLEYATKPTAANVATGTALLGDIDISTARTLTTSATTKYLGVGAYTGQAGTSWVGLKVSSVQLVEGTTAPPFEPYVEVNSKPIVLNEWEYAISNSSLTSLDNHIGSGWNLRNLFNQLKAPIDSVLIDGVGNVIERVPTFNDLAKFNQYYLTPESTWLNVQSDADLKFPYQLIYKPTKPTYAKKIQYPNVFKTYQPTNKPTQSGLAMNGTTNYLQLPKMTMDSVEIDCIVDHVNTSAVMIDARPSSGYMYHETSKGAGIINHYVDGVFNVPLIKGKRVKVKVESGSAFTEDINIFSSASYGEHLKGTLFGVKCFLNGKVVAEYDFTNRNEKAKSVIVGLQTWKLAKR